MTKRFLLYLSCLVSTGLLLGACSRPVAHYQRGPVIHYSSAQPNTTVVNNAVAQTDAPTATSTKAVTSVELTNQTNAAVEQLEAYVRNDNKLAANKRASKRIDRLKRLVAESAATNTVSSANTAHKMTVLERFMVKKLNKKISKHLTPDSSKKTMINGGLLGGSLVLIIVGILLLALTSGGGAVIGLVLAIVGALGLVYGLLAS